MNRSQAATHLAVAAIAMTAMSAVLWAGPAASASGSRAAMPSGAAERSGASVSAARARVKFYVVPRPGKGQAETLYDIAAKTLGSGSRFMEIFDLNKGRPQPKGGRLENPHAIEPGWVLRLPADASGPGVHFGPLPVVTTAATSRASHPTSRPSASPAATPHLSPGRAGSDSAAIVGGALIIFALAGLGIVLIWRRRLGATAGRRAAHARPPAPRPGNAGPQAPNRAAVPAATGRRPGSAESGWPYSDHPSWPAGADGPDWPQPGTDHPSWPANAVEPGWPYGSDHPSWPVNAVDPSWPYPGSDHPSWPAGGTGGPGRSRAHRSGSWQQREGPASPHHDQAQRTTAPTAPVQVPATRPGYPVRPAAGAHARTQQRSAQLARTQDPATQTYNDLAFGDGRLQVVLTEPPASRREWATGLHARPQEPLQLATGQATGLANPAEWQAGELRNADSVRLAERILTDADYQAAEIRREASAQAAAIREAAEKEAAEIRQQAAAQAAPIREGVEREAAEIRQQAAAQAAAIREAAEMEAIELRAHVLAMAAELGRVAAYVTENLTSPTIPALPATRPAAQPITEPKTRPVTKPAARPASKPKTRQYKAVRRMVVATVALVFFASVAGSAEIAVHGFGFFAFRQGGTGASDGKFTDQQFLARSAGTAHHKVTPHNKPKAHHKAKAHHHPKAKKAK